MNLVYLSPHYPSHYSQFVEALARHGVRVFGISDLPDEALDPRVRQALSGHYKVERLENHQQVIDAAGFFHEKVGEIDRVESHLEPWIELEAMVRDAFNVTGPKPEQLQFIKRKSLMKEVFKKAGVPAARGIVIKDMQQCLDFINDHYPVFIKPDIGVGAADTYTIRSEDDLKKFFAGKQDYDYFMEEFVDGDLQSFDGLTDKDNNIVFCTSHVFSNDIHKVVKNNENVWYYSQIDIPAEIEKYGRAVVKAADVREKFFHIEFFKLKNGKYQVLEINMRPPGGLTTHMFNFACDIDVYDWWASIMAGHNPKRPFSRRYHCAFIGRKHDRSYKYSHDQLYAKWGERIVHSQPMAPIEYDVMGHWGYLARSANLDELKKIIRDLTWED
ncbi:MAG TPA: ATP-grasp domain-containing protein [Candidatus Rifleibacterium sp.]|nr:ATP-grasp domain-containing protein [Candidatus Rifleibacterium sp.]HPT44668.1 ATP-grasp domain-containing protein [Candidatus Rifleibacterium sp.]